MIRLERVSRNDSLAVLVLAGLALSGLGGCSGTVEPARVAVPTGAAVVDPNQPPMPSLKDIAPATGKMGKGKGKSAKK